MSELVPCRRHAQRGLLGDAFSYVEGGSARAKQFHAGVSQEARGTYDTSFPSFMNSDVDI